MILYNVTISIEPAINDQWVKWMKEIHIPEMMNTDCFEEFRFLELKSDIEPNSGITYCTQYWCKSKTDLDNYLNNYADELREKHQKKFINKFVTFRTVLEEI